MRSKGTVADMRSEVVLAQLVAEWFRVIGFICTHMLNRVLGVWSWHDGLLEQVQHDQVVVGVGRCKMNGQWSTALIHPEMAFRAQFGSIRGIGSGKVTAQRSRH